MLILSGEKNLIKIQLQTIIILHSQRQRGTSRVKEKNTGLGKSITGLL